MARQFNLSKAVRKAVPLLVGLAGPSSSGKTKSALRLAAGMQRAMGGKVYGIDTESNRMLHYADEFDFVHLPMGAPFSPGDYLEAVNACVADSNGAPATIVVDSISHSWEGDGGVLDMQEAALTKMAGSDYKKRQALTFLAWNKPKRESRRFINAILQLPVNFIFCFRAKEKLIVEKGKEPRPAGWMPIGDKDYIFEFGISALLRPGCQGVPDWSPKEEGEQTWVKFPGWSRDILTSGDKSIQLDEAIGEKLARWSIGNGAPKASELLSDLRKLETPSELGSVLRTLKAWANAFSESEKADLRVEVENAKGRIAAAEKAREEASEALEVGDVSGNEES